MDKKTYSTEEHRSMMDDDEISMKVTMMMMLFVEDVVGKEQLYDRRDLAVGFLRLFVVWNF